MPKDFQYMFCFRLMQLELHDVPDIMGTVTAKSYLDLFDTDQLVYLSPDGRQVYC